MADCSNLEEGLYCQKLGFDIVGSRCLATQVVL